jgi:hypothetical protein
MRETLAALRKKRFCAIQEGTQLSTDGVIDDTKGGSHFQRLPHNATR